MEAVGAAASTIALVQVALKTIKAVHEIISAVKDGPQTVKDLVDQVHELESVLNRIITISQSATPRNVTDAAALQSAVTKCEGDLKDVASRLQRLTISPADKRSGRLWKRVKLVIGEKDIENLRQVIQGHVKRLSLQLSVMAVSHMVVSESQQSEMLTLLKQILTVVNTPTPVTDITAPTAPACSDPLPEEAPLPAPPSLDDSITRLTGLVTEKECTINSEDASQLIEDLKALLEAAKDEHDRLSTSSSEDIKKELELAKNLMLSAPATEINKLALDPLPHIPVGTIVAQTRKQRAISLNGGVLVVSASSKHRRRRLDRQHETQSKERDLNFKITFHPEGGKHMISLRLNQGQVGSYYFSSIPKLLVSNILPEASRIFGWACCGTPRDLQKFIEEGKGSLRDHNSFGWSLLHYAVAWGNVPMCKFLIQSGLDPDELAYYNQAKVGCNTFSLVNILPEKVVHVDDMVQALLEGGGDPNLSGGDNIIMWGKMILWCDMGSNAHFSALKATLDISPYLIDLASDRHPRSGHTLFLTMWDLKDQQIWCGRLRTESRLETLSLLLRRGSSVNERTKFGETCLHLFFKNGNLGPRGGHDLIPSLKYIIQQGADVHAKSTWNGPSVSELAYLRPCSCYPEPWIPSSGSYRGDLWDSVLDACGYQIRDFRVQEGIQRIAKYNWKYKRRDFELLWKGREERCPYWDDTPWPPVSEMEFIRPGNEPVNICHFNQTCYYKDKEEWNVYSSEWEVWDSDTDDEHACDSESDDGGADL